MRVGAVALAILTVAAVIFAALNFKQREVFPAPDDGVTWLDTPAGVQAWHVAPGSPAEKAASGPAITSKPSAAFTIRRATQVTQMLFRAGEWTELTYQHRARQFHFRHQADHRARRKSVVARKLPARHRLFYLFIGLFIFARRWNAPRAVHFYLFCLASFIFYSFHYSGKLNLVRLDDLLGQCRRVALAARAAGSLCAGFPRAARPPLPKILAVYSVPAVLLLVLHVLCGRRPHRRLLADRLAHCSGSRRTCLPRRLLPGRRADFCSELSPLRHRNPSPTIKVGHRRHSSGHRCPSSSSTSSRTSSA